MKNCKTTLTLLKNVKNLAKKIKWKGLCDANFSIDHGDKSDINQHIKIYRRKGKWLLVYIIQTFLTSNKNIWAPIEVFLRTIYVNIIKVLDH